MMALLKTLTRKYSVYILVHFVMLLFGVGLFVMFDSALLDALGTGLIGAGTVGWIILVHLLYDESLKKKLDKLIDFGFVDAFPARSVQIRDEYTTRLSKAKKHIDIMGFGLSSMREDFQDDFDAWALKAKVRILLIDPEAPVPGHEYARQRALEERETPDEIISDVKSFLLTTRNQIANKNFDIKFYTCLPSVNIFRIDDEIFWGPYLVHSQSRSTPTFIVQHGGVMFERLEQHFETIWNDSNLSRCVPPDYARENS